MKSVLGFLVVFFLTLIVNGQNHDPRVDEVYGTSFIEKHEGTNVLSWLEFKAKNGYSFETVPTEKLQELELASSYFPNDTDWSTTEKFNVLKFNGKHDPDERVYLRVPGEDKVLIIYSHDELLEQYKASKMEEK
ncbi:hypothetical protein [Salibacter halophilus]|uniref:Uncharacterized protein n=1 Tax=Salibacter halophilus TaxID=1803916 RepID=A0A6N6M5V1_9FLAO|nr:hypothetical protein [Salibacter halophilus]KAB1062682.1 hypothetical protein F3059_12105 [Salibacter halophilus]